MERRPPPAFRRATLVHAAQRGLQCTGYGRQATARGTLREGRQRAEAPGRGDLGHAWYVARNVGPIRHILVPVDFSPGSQAALDLAAQVGRALAAKVTIFHVYTPPNALSAIVPGVAIEEDVRDETDALVRRLESIAADLRVGGDLAVETAVIAGPPKQTIVDHAHVGAFDLIVMGTHGRTGLSRLVLGSVAEHVLRHASCPVTTVRLAAAPPP
jgi:nucleotide-binding universal stress UspA family protein